MRKIAMLLIVGKLVCGNDSSGTDQDLFASQVMFPEHDDVRHVDTGMKHLDLSFVPRAKGEIGNENIAYQQKKDLQKLHAALRSPSEPTKVQSIPSADAEDKKVDAMYKHPDLAKKLSLETKKSNVRDLLEMIGRVVGIDFIIDPSLEGELGNIKLKGCTAGQALQLICKKATPQASVVKSGDSWHVTTREEARNMLKDVLEENHVHQVLPVNHAKMDQDFQKKVEDGWRNIVKDNKAASLQIDSDQKNIHVRGPKKDVQAFYRYLREVDKPILQVRIDVIVVLATKEFFFEFGIDWSGIYNREKSIKASGTNFGFWGLGGTPLDFPDPKLKNQYTQAKPPPVVPDPPNKHNPNLFVNPLNFAINLFNSGSLFYSSTPSDSQVAGLIRLPFVFGGPDLSLRRLNMILNLAEVEEKVNIITRPSILTSNNKWAKILIGQSLPLQTTIEDLTASSTRNITTINYKDTGISLEVKPVVNPDRKSIYLDILVEDSVVESGDTSVNDKGIMTNPPVISMIKTKNEVVLRNGQTTIIGGLSAKNQAQKKRSVPFFSDLPVVGNLFKSSLDANKEQERYIFITPKIIEYEP